jgi:hypothetical protein
MDSHRLSHLKRSLIACFALCLVLAGTAYASVQVAQRLTAGVTCGGRCPATRVYWTYITATGVPGSLSPGPTVQQTALGGVPAQIYHVQTGSWIVRFSGQDLSNCAKFANLTSIRGSATVGEYSSTNTDPTAIPVLTTDANGHPFDADFVVGVFCGGGIGAQTTQ